MVNKALTNKHNHHDTRQLQVYPHVARVLHLIDLKFLKLILNLIFQTSFCECRQICKNNHNTYRHGTYVQLIVHKCYSVDSLTLTALTFQYELTEQGNLWIRSQTATHCEAFPDQSRIQSVYTFFKLLYL